MYLNGPPAFCALVRNTVRLGWKEADSCSGLQYDCVARKIPVAGLQVMFIYSCSLSIVFHFSSSLPIAYCQFFIEYCVSPIVPYCYSPMTRIPESQPLVQPPQVQTEGATAPQVQTKGVALDRGRSQRAPRSALQGVYCTPPPLYFP
jgi:hypothetical protein